MRYIQNGFCGHGMFGPNRVPILHQDYHYLQTYLNELPFEPRNLRVPSSASKMIYQLTVRLVQTIHLSCTNTNTFSKRIKMRFQMTHVTKDFHPLCPKWFMWPCFVWPKPCTYLASRLPLSPNELKWASTWASQPRSGIRCVQNDFWAYDMFGTNHSPILH
jgi:hypothetical protein